MRWRFWGTPSSTYGRVCLRGGSFSAHDAQVEAVQLLMRLNREIYFGCPEVPTFGDRFSALLYQHTA